MINLTNLGYVAGILDGEGCFNLKHNGTGRYYPRVMVRSTDLDILKKCKLITNLGSIYFDRKSTDTHKATWVWEVRKQSEAISLMLTAYPFLCNRRQEKIETILKQWRQN